MSLPCPAWIPESALQALPLRHTWDDRNPYSVLHEPEEVVADLIERISDKGQTAFVLGCAEWVVRRLGKLVPDPMPLQYLEAGWAMLADEWAGRLWEPESWGPWMGPARGPVALALLNVTNSFYSIGTGDGEAEAGLAPMLVRHVVGEHTAFLRWQDAVLARLVRHFPPAPDEAPRPPIPRTILDPVQPFADDVRDAEAAAFLAGLDWNANPFLVPPDQRPAPEPE